MYHIAADIPESKVRTILRNIIFKKGRLKCPHCGCFKILSVKKEGRYHCRRCRKKFSLLSGTWMKNVKIPLPLFVILLSFWLEDVTVQLAEKLTGLSRPTLYGYYRLFRTHIVQTIDFTPQTGVQVDEAYFGTFKKQANWMHGRQTYRVVGKVCVAGISCPATGQLATMVVEGKPGKLIKRFIRKLVPEDVTVYSDGSPIYTMLRDSHLHIARTHDRGFHNAYYVESCWSWMKRKLFRQYHHFTKKYAKNYVSELTFKFNTRNSS
ncbi:MAG: IS1595 family transposase [Patescibacteria group bacterium]|nr:IS1595 family transposase [Patescibacteria group bacterium]